MIIDQTVDINGAEYQIVINHSVPHSKKTPIFIYINQNIELPQFGGYIYSIKARDESTVQVILKSGEFNDLLKNMGNLISLKYDCPSFININGVNEFDYKFLLMKLMELINI